MPVHRYGKHRPCPASRSHTMRRAAGAAPSYGLFATPALCYATHSLPAQGAAWSSYATPSLHKARLWTAFASPVWAVQWLSMPVLGLERHRITLPVRRPAVNRKAMPLLRIALRCQSLPVQRPAMYRVAICALPMHRCVLHRRYIGVAASRAARVSRSGRPPRSMISVSTPVRLR